MNKPHICTVPDCPFNGKYCRFHRKDTVTEEVNRQKEYLKVKKEYMKEHQNCEFEGCKKRANDLHHKRGRVGDLLTDKRYFLSLCRDHHNWVGLHPVESMERGYSESRLKKENA